MKLSGYIRIPVARGTLTATALTTAIALAGCGGSSTQSASTPPPPAKAAPPGEAEPTPGGEAGERPAGAPPRRQASGSGERPPKVTLEVKIPGLTGRIEPKIPTRYTCDGTNTSLPIHWSAIPHGTAQLALFLIGLKPVHNTLFFSWAVAGLNPATHGFPAGKLPAGAIVARNSYGNAGYSICPPKGTRENYILRLVALPHPLTAKPGVSAEALYREAEHGSKNVGLAGGVYAR